MNRSIAFPRALGSALVARAATIAPIALFARATLLVAVAAALGGAAAPASAQAPPRDAYADAFHDPGARALYDAAVARRDSVDRSISRYQTTSRERFSASLRAIGREWLLYRRETAGRIDWRRGGPVRIEVLGAREVVPVVNAEAHVPSGLESYMPHLAYNRVDFDAIVRMDTSFVRDPFRANSVTHYRYRSGDTTTVRLADGRMVRVIELEVLPRQKDPHLLIGSFWIDQASHAIVQAVFRLSDSYELVGDDEYDDDDDDDDVPAYIRPSLERFVVTVDYALWELRWWMPLHATAEGVVQVGSIMSMPIEYQLAYSDYVVEGDPASPALPAARPDAASPAEPMPECPLRVTVQVDVDDDDRAARDTAARPPADSTGSRRVRDPAVRDSIRSFERAAAAEAEGDTARARRILRSWERRRDCRRRYDVVVPEDRDSLLSSPFLPGTIYESDEPLIPIARLEELARRVEDLADAPWQLAAPSFAWGFGAPGLLRYNRVEGLSVGGRLDFDFGPITAELGGRIGTADLEPNVELALRRARANQDWRLAAYHMLATPDPANKPFGFGNTMNALLFGRDDGFYYRADGVSLSARPPATDAQMFDWRVYAERQRAVGKETDFSFARLLDSDHEFRDNIEAARADQFGTQLTLRADVGRDPSAARWGAELTTRAEAGTFDFMRPSALLRASVPLPIDPLLPGRSWQTGWSAAVEVAAGGAAGDVPIQSAYYLGGPATLRGYAPGTHIGDSFWRARLEVGRGIPAARIVAFSDLGWAGPRDAFELRTRDALGSAGIGLSILDGLIRFDVARAFMPPTGWRVELYVGGAM